MYTALEVDLEHKKSLEKALARIREVLLDSSMADDEEASANDYVFEFGSKESGEWVNLEQSMTHLPVMKGWNFEKSAYYFYQAVLNHGLEKKLADLVSLVIKEGLSAYYSDVETTVLLEAVTLLAYYDIKYVRLYADYMVDVDMGHEVFVTPVACSLMEHYGWTPETMHLLGVAAALSWHVSDEYIDSRMEKDEKFLRALKDPELSSALIEAASLHMKEDPADENDFITRMKLLAAGDEILIDLPEGDLAFSIPDDSDFYELPFFAREVMGISVYPVQELKSGVVLYQGEAPKTENPSTNIMPIEKFIAPLAFQKKKKAILEQFYTTLCDCPLEEVIEYLKQHPWISADDVMQNIVYKRTPVEEAHTILTCRPMRVISHNYCINKILWLYFRKGTDYGTLLEKVLAEKIFEIAKEQKKENDPDYAPVLTYMLRFAQDNMGKKYQESYTHQDFKQHIEPVLMVLLKYGADINQLLGPIIFNYPVETIRKLIELGADVYHQTRYDNYIKSILESVPWLAPRRGRSAKERENDERTLAVLELLLPYFKEQINETHGKESILYFACKTGKKEFVQVILEYEPDLELLNREGETPFLYACRMGFYPIAHLLLQKGAKTHVSYPNGQSLIDTLKDEPPFYSDDYQVVIQYLKDQG